MGYNLAESNMENTDSSGNVNSSAVTAIKFSETIVEFCDELWEPSAGLLVSLTPHEGQARHKTIRESVWYSLGLLSRNRDGDFDRACQTLNGVLAHQIDSLGTPFHGTFRRHTGEPRPDRRSRPYKDYDPNWREFVGTTLCLILAEFGSGLPAPLAKKIEAAIFLAASGSIRRHVPVTYSNIFLLRVGLLALAGEFLDNSAFFRAAEHAGLRFQADFEGTSVMHEFNSPTYYGVDLFALSLWRGMARSPILQAAADSIEKRLWECIAELYHPRLQNMCGPFDRAYGMDMRSYVSLLGMWLKLATAGQVSPVPVPTRKTAHIHDLPFGLCFAFMRPDVSVEMQSRLCASTQPRFVSTIVGSRQGTRRAVTAWLEGKVMIGASSHAITEWDQCCPATIHWELPDGRIGWIRSVASSFITAAAGERLLKIGNLSAVATICHLRVGGADSLQLRCTRNKWELPGLQVEVEAPLGTFGFRPRNGLWEISYELKGGSTLALRVSSTSDKSESEC